jgi:hypothetical protein
MVVADGKGTPLGLLTESAAPGEVKLIEKTFDTVRVPKLDRGRPKKRFAAVNR